MSFIEIIMIPEQVSVKTEDGWTHLQNTICEKWTGNNIEVNTLEKTGQLDISINAAHIALERVVLRWHRKIEQDVRLMGDHWERGYGDLEWRGIVPERVMPWYFLIYDGERTHGYGVKTGPKAMCFWQVSEDWITLCLDVRCGGRGVLLGVKTLHAATVVSREGMEDETPFTAATKFCKQLCKKPLIPKQPVYGGNNWYYAYGNSSHEQILEDSKLMSSLATSSDNRPFMVIDDGWQVKHNYSYNGGPWDSGNNKFPDMHKLAEEMKEIGTIPGIWTRPLLHTEKVPATWCLPEIRFKQPCSGDFYDPSIPEVLELIKQDIQRFAGWGYELIKQDFSTFDLLGRWGFDLNYEMTNSGWNFYDCSKTTAEVILDLYNAIKSAAGSALVIGCNTMSHLAAGIFEIQRTGDDTSGRVWERTRKMGINTLAFRMPQHGTFYAVDADCVGVTDQIPWHLNEQWLRLLSLSGTPLFVSADPRLMGLKQRKAIGYAFDIASKTIPLGEPLDWMYTTCPQKWLLNGTINEFNWN